MTKSKAQQAEDAAQKATEDESPPDAPNAPQEGAQPREAAVGAFFVPPNDDDRAAQERIDELHRIAASAPVARSQWDG